VDYIHTLLICISYLIDHVGICVCMYVSMGVATQVKLLLAQGAQLDIRDLKGHTALMWAAVHQHADVVECLVAAGCDLKVRDEENRDIWTYVTGENIQKAITQGQVCIYTYYDLILLDLF